MLLDLRNQYPVDWNVCECLDPVKAIHSTTNHIFHRHVNPFLCLPQRKASPSCFRIRREHNRLHGNRMPSVEPRLTKFGHPQRREGVDDGDFRCPPHFVTTTRRIAGTMPGTIEISVSAAHASKNEFVRGAKAQIEVAKEGQPIAVFDRLVNLKFQLVARVSQLLCVLGKGQPDLTCDDRD